MRALGLLTLCRMLQELASRSGTQEHGRSGSLDRGQLSPSLMQHIQKVQAHMHGPLPPGRLMISRLWCTATRWSAADARWLLSGAGPQHAGLLC